MGSPSVVSPVISPSGVNHVQLSTLRNPNANGNGNGNAAAAAAVAMGMPSTAGTPLLTSSVPITVGTPGQSLTALPPPSSQQPQPPQPQQSIPLVTVT
jgi:hypothetical protein